MSSAEVYRRATKVAFAEAPLAAGAPAAPPVINPLCNGAFATTSDGRRALLVGGYANGASLTQVLEYDTATKLWSNLSAICPFPEPRSEATLAAVKSGAFYLFGGYDDAGCKGDTWVLRTALGPEGGSTKIVAGWERLATGASGPSPRRMHSMATLTGPDGNTRLYVFGGFDGTQRLNDLWEFDPEAPPASAWRLVPVVGTPPAPRDLCVLAGDNAARRLFLYGGFATARCNDVFWFDLAESRWVRVATELGPSPRMGCFGCINNGYAVVGLGQDTKGPTALVCQLNLTDMKWSVAPLEGDEVEPRMHASVAVVDGGKRVLVLGGTNDKKYSTSLLEIELERSEAALPQKGKK